VPAGCRKLEGSRPIGSPTVGRDLRPATYAANVCRPEDGVADANGTQVGSSGSWPKRVRSWMWRSHPHTCVFPGGAHGGKGASGVGDNEVGQAIPSREDVIVTVEAEMDEPVGPADRAAIVVGHDGSRGADHALAAALELAEALAAPVVVARAWSIATAPRPAGAEFGYVPGFDELAEAVRLSLVDDTRETTAAYPALAVECRAVHGNAAKRLVEISQDARMLVVGTRGLGGLAGMLLGSVSDQCVRHAACPVLVTRSSD
jgi:nucleotide-binding universal stress UspA family protein